jgi:hypothetical protein
MDWCVYSLKENKVTSDHSLVVKIDCPLENNTYIATGVSQHKVDSAGITLQQAIAKVSQNTTDRDSLKNH